MSLALPTLHATNKNCLHLQPLLPSVYALLPTYISLFWSPILPVSTACPKWSVTIAVGRF